jgi:hypothetical protein
MIRRRRPRTGGAIVQDGKPTSHFLVILVAITAVIVLNGIAYRAVLHPVLGGSTKTGLSYRDICSRPWGMDAAQFESHVERFKGKPVTGWTGWVCWGPPQQGSFHQIGISLDMPGDLTWGRDIELFGVPASLSGRLRWGQQVTFSGTVRQVVVWGELCQIIIEDVSFMLPGN